MKKPYKNIAVGVLSMMMIGSSLNLFMNSGLNKTEASTNPTKVETNENTRNAIPDSKPQMFQVEDEEMSYLIKEEETQHADSSSSQVLQSNLHQRSEMEKLPEEVSGRLQKDGFTLSDIKQVNDLAKALNENPDAIAQKAKENHKDWTLVKKELLQEKKYKLPEALETKYANELQTIAALKLGKEQRLQFITLLEQRPDLKAEDITAAMASYGTTWLGEELKRTAEEQTFDQKKLNKYNLKAEDIVGVTASNLAMLQKIADKTNQPLKELIANFKQYQGSQE